MGLKNNKNTSKKSKRQQKSELETGFQMDAVHVHLTCHCSVLPMMKLNKEKGIVEIPVPSICPVCRIGTTTGVVLGGMICDTDAKCPHPGCTCEQVVMQGPHQQFLYCLQKGRDED